MRTLHGAGRRAGRQGEGDAHRSVGRGGSTSNDIRTSVGVYALGRPETQFKAAAKDAARQLGPVVQVCVSRGGGVRTGARDGSHTCPRQGL